MPRCLLAGDPVHFVFDLDDTLYAEEDYVRSALRHVSEWVEARYDVSGAGERLREFRAAGQHDPIAALWNEYKLPGDAKADALDAMRAHNPDIELRPDAAAFLGMLRAEARGYAIVTDGRSTTQRLKIAALGCLDANCISISEEAGLAKTDPGRFTPIEDCLGPGRYVYVGDNPRKDFAAPNRLGWLTVMLAHGGSGVHRQDFPDDPHYHPRAVIQSFAELQDVVAKHFA